MKRCSFEVAKALKEVGYPQNGNYWYSKEGIECYSESDLDEIDYTVSPTYLEIWLWLWRQKKIHIDIDKDVCKEGVMSFDDITFEEYKTDDPEEAIIAAIEHLVEHKLLK